MSSIPASTAGRGDRRLVRGIPIIQDCNPGSCGRETSTSPPPQCAPSDVRCILRSLSKLTESKVFGSMRNPSDLLNLGVCPDEVAEAVEMVPSGGAGSHLTCLSKLAWTKAYVRCKCRLLVYGSSGIDFRLGRRGQTRRHGASSSVTGLGKSLESKDEIIK